MRTRLRGVAIALVISGSVVGILAASAAASPFDNQYQGRVEADSATYLGFNVAKSHGKRKLKTLKTFLPYHCQDGDGGNVFARSTSGLKIDSAGHFAGKLKMEPQKIAIRGGRSFQHFTSAISGKLQKHGKAVGKIDAGFSFTTMEMRGGTTVRCYSGGLDWKAKRGADATPSSRSGR